MRKYRLRKIAKTRQKLEKPLTRSMQVFYTANKKVIRDDLKVVKCTKINHQVD